MFSCSSRRLLLPKFGLLAVAVMFVGACAAGASTSALTLTTDAPGGGTAGVAGVAAPAVATVPSATASKVASQAEGLAATPTAPSAVAAGLPSSGTTGTVYGFAAPELESWSSSEQVHQLEAMKATGVTSVRVDANWNAVQPTGPGIYEWGSLDQMMASIQTAGLSADLIINRCPTWAAVSGAAGNQYAEPTSAAAYATFAAAVAQRYSGEGAKYFEIWNEPNIPQFWAPKPDPAAYTALLKAAYPAIKAVDPSAVVISGGLAPAVNSSNSYSQLAFLQDMYADGAQGSFDGIGYHPYSYPADPDTFNTWSGWSEMAQTSPSIKSIMAANGDSTKKIYVTEYGAPTSGTDANVSDADQATELTQAITEAKADNWIGSFYIYTWEDFSGDGFGLLTSSGAQKPAYADVVNALSS